MEVIIEMNKNIEIIKQAYLILEKGYCFHKSTSFLNNVFFEGVSEENHKILDYKLKAIRQDFAKILIMMNTINKTYSAYQKNEYIPSYISIANEQATSELGCFIEYLFAKYRVILEYIQQILEICILPILDAQNKEDYNKLKKAHKRYKFLLKYISENIEETKDILNIEWFQNLRVDRDFIIHDGATCLVFGDKENLLFKVMTTDALDKEEESEQDEFFLEYNGLVNYSYYWGLYISKLIVFSETIFQFLLSIGNLKDEYKFFLDNELLYCRNTFVDNDGIELNDVQDVLINMLSEIIEREDVNDI